MYHDQLLQTVNLTVTHIQKHAPSDTSRHHQQKMRNEWKKHTDFPINGTGKRFHDYGKWVHFNIYKVQTNHSMIALLFFFIIKSASIALPVKFNVFVLGLKKERKALQHKLY